MATKHRNRNADAQELLDELGLEDSEVEQVEEADSEISGEVQPLQSADGEVRQEFSLQVDEDELEDEEELEEEPKPQTKSALIRELLAEGLTVSQISKRTKFQYQMVYQVAKAAHAIKPNDGTVCRTCGRPLEDPLVGREA